MGYVDDGGGDLFTDDNDHLFEADIDRLATAGVTTGCNPPDNYRFCPDDLVTRGQMAAFVKRAYTPPPDLCEVNEVSAADCRALLAIHDPASFWGIPAPWLTKRDMCSWPTVICDGTEVTRLVLRNRSVKGPMPSEIGDLANLRSLRIGRGLNGLTGHLPPEVGDLANLEVLEIGQIGGPLPSTIGNLTNLRELNIGFTDLTGPIPAEIGNLTNLTLLWLYDNPLLDGPIPAEIGNLMSLQRLSLANGDLSGPIPPTLGNLTNLEELDVHGNRLAGSIPLSLGNLTDLNYLSLYRNRLSGEVPTQLLNLMNLTNLYLKEQEGCLFTNSQALADWLSSFDPSWNDGCL
jgi:hypothetical protein